MPFRAKAVKTATVKIKRGTSKNGKGILAFNIYTPLRGLLKYLVVNYNCWPHGSRPLSGTLSGTLTLFSTKKPIRVLQTFQVFIPMAGIIFIV
jgi:hypothetical protein